MHQHIYDDLYAMIGKRVKPIFGSEHWAFSRNHNGVVIGVHIAGPQHKYLVVAWGRQINVHHPFEIEIREGSAKRTNPQKPAPAATSLSDWDRIFSEQKALLDRRVSVLAALEKHLPTPDAVFTKAPDMSAREEQDRVAALAGCIKALEEMEFTTDDLDFILVFLTMCWGRQPAALFAQLLALRDADAANPSQPSC